MAEDWHRGGHDRADRTPLQEGGERREDDADRDRRREEREVRREERAERREERQAEREQRREDRAADREQRREARRGRDAEPPATR